MGWWWIVIGVVSFLAGLTVWAWKEELAFQILLLRRQSCLFIFAFVFVIKTAVCGKNHT